jgi:hypothetical protein
MCNLKCSKCHERTPFCQYLDNQNWEQCLEEMYIELKACKECESRPKPVCWSGCALCGGIWLNERCPEKKPSKGHGHIKQCASCAFLIKKE